MPFETFLGRLKVKVTLEGYINELFWAITPTYMHGFQNNFARVFSLKTKIAICNICSCTYTYPPPFTPPPPPSKKKSNKKKIKKKRLIRISLSIYRKISPPPKKKNIGFFAKKNHLHYPLPPSPRPHIPHPAQFFSDLDYLPT